MSKTFVPGDVVRRVRFENNRAWQEFCCSLGDCPAVVAEAVNDKLRLQGSYRWWTANNFDLVPGVRAKHLPQQPDSLEDNVDHNNIDYPSAIEAAELRAAKSAAHAAAEAARLESLRQQQAEVEAAAAAEAARIAAIDADLALLEATRHLLQGIKLDSLTLPKQAVPFRKELQPLANKHGYKLVLIGDGTTIALCKLNVKA